MMPGTPKHANQGEIKSRLSTLPRVMSVHDLRVWILKYDKLVASVHLVLGEFVCLLELSFTH